MKFLTYSLLLLLSFFVSVHTADAGVLAKPANSLNLSGYWAFNEGTGTTYGDSSGNGNNGTVTGAPTWINGKRGKALSFDGSDDHIVVTDSISLRQSTDWTMSAWIKIKNNDPGAGADRIIVGKQGWHGGLLRLGDAIWFNITNTVGTNHTISYSVTPEEWHHYTATYTGSSGAMELFVDGVSAGTTTFNTGTTMNYQGTSDLYIGGSGTEQYHTFAEIDEVRIYSRKLTAAQVAALYQSGSAIRKGVSERSLVGHWNFDEGAGTKAGDISGNGNTGTLSGTPVWTNGRLGKAILFDGTDDYVDWGTPPTINYTQSYTLSAWLKPERFAHPSSNCGDQRTYAVVQSVSSFDFIELATNNSNIIYFRQWGSPSGVSASSGTLTADQWYHAVARYDQSASEIKLFINGTLVSTGSTSGVTLTNPASANFRVGWGSLNCANPYFKGNIDDVRLYSRALSDTEIKTLYTTAAQKINSSQNSQMTSGLINLWSFNGADISNGVILDRAGSVNGNPELIATSTFYTAGKIGQGVEFNGSNNVDLASSITLSHTSNWTASVWAKTTSSGDMHLLTNQSGGPVSNSLRIVSGKINYYHYNGVWNSNSGSVTINDGNWHHLAWVNSSNATMVMYVDGVADGSSFASDNGGPVNRIGNIWGEPGANGLVGTMDELRLYNRALTAAEVKQLYLMGR